MSCEYCKSEEKHGEDIASYENADYCEPITVCIWEDGMMHIETEVDNLYASIKIKYCPMCCEAVDDESLSVVHSIKAKMYDMQQTIEKNG